MSRLWSCFVGCDGGAETFDEIKSHLSMVAVFIELFNGEETEIQTSVFQMLYQLICVDLIYFLFSCTHKLTRALQPNQLHRKTISGYLHGLQ